MSNKQYLPESMYKVDSNMNYKKIQSICDSQDTITGRIIRLDLPKERFIVDLGGNIAGLMPFSDSTIYPIKKDKIEDYSVYIYNLPGKIIRCKVLSFDEPRICLSRKAHMLEALESLKNESEFTAELTSYSKFSAFFDIGAGIIGRSVFKNFAPVKYRDINEVCINYGSIITVKAIRLSNDFNSFEVSRVDALPLACDVFKKGEMVSAKIFDSIPTVENFAYYALVNNTHCGIVNSTEELNYGDNIFCYLKSVKENKIKLVFCERN